VYLPLSKKRDCAKLIFKLSEKRDSDIIGKNMDKRYQVFVSSTYEDLIEERLEVMKALLELDCIPCGMEYFPAANEDAWTFIKKLIDVCDYYVVIVGGKYGSKEFGGHNT
jgi:hypothetical protein